jgi:electron transport complex protein RnfC
VGSTPPESKDLTEHLAIEAFPAPEEVDILLIQHFGAPCKPLFKKKDAVSEDDLIGEMESGLGASIHSSVTGTIKNIGSSAANPVSVSSPSITIKIDPEIQPKEYTPSDWKKLSGEESIGRIKQAGIVGIGGAGFPAHIKLASSS